METSFSRKIAKIGAILLALFAAFLIFKMIKGSIEYENRPFNQISFEENNTVVNRTEIAYLDTIVLAGLHELKMTNKTVLILPMDQKSLGGDLELKAHIKPSGPGYIIWITQSNGRYTSVDIIAHELIHLQQYETGKLKINDLEKSVTFDGVTYPLANMPDYSNRPWEEQAFQKSEYLSQNMLELLR